MSERKTKMKLSSRRNGTLVPDDDDSDSDLQEFPLPKKRIIKPGKSTYVARLDPPSALFYQDEKPVRSSAMHFIFFPWMFWFIFERFRRRCGCCRVCASVFLSILLIASVLCVLVLGWFSLRLKRDLDFMRKRLSKGKFELWVIHLLFLQLIRSRVHIFKILCRHSVSFTNWLNFNTFVRKFDYQYFFRLRYASQKMN